MCVRMLSASARSVLLSTAVLAPPNAFATPEKYAGAWLVYTSSAPPINMPVTFFAASMHAAAHSATEHVNA